MEPESGTSSAPRRCINVLLPAPDGPTIDVNWPPLIRRVSPSRARTVCPPARYSRTTSMRSTVSATSPLEGDFQTGEGSLGKAVPDLLTDLAIPSQCATQERRHVRIDRLVVGRIHVRERWRACQRNEGQSKNVSCRSEDGRIQHRNEVLNVLADCRRTHDAQDLHVYSRQLAPVATRYCRCCTVPAPIEVVDPVVPHDVVGSDGDGGNRRLDDVVQVDDRLETSR